MKFKELPKNTEIRNINKLKWWERIIICLIKLKISEDEPIPGFHVKFKIFRGKVIFIGWISFPPNHVNCRCSIKNIIK